MNPQNQWFGSGNSDGLPYQLFGAGNTCSPSCNSSNVSNYCSNTNTAAPLPDAGPTGPESCGTQNYQGGQVIWGAGSKPNCGDL